MNKETRQLAIIGPTASGKSNLAVTIAKEWNALILSLDSLSVYKEIDIVSAKPSLKEREDIPHYGIDTIYPDEPFDVTVFTKLYRTVFEKARTENKNLIIVGGTGFYLKSLIDGISPLPPLNPSLIQNIQNEMSDMEQAYRMLTDLDAEYMKRIEKNDSYRIEKALGILLATGERPSRYFEKNPPLPTIREQLPLYRIVTDKGVLRDCIAKRTEQMLNDGLINEISYLERKYSRVPNCMKAIGIRETLDYLDGKYNKNTLIEKITANTARLAKRQTTFNKSQFEDLVSLDLESLKKRIMEDILK
ncbi:MAG: tRNA (adenosine(37)-N6)-dimethylallyltransferase MiaA [Campylobacterota bacterium]|nr:tRNA (adenosine(37)-N6)-dimethylallyltransferase MiaA [Campylobacterota bacterium]